MSEMQRILVAGGTGTLGRHVVRELQERGHTVSVLTRQANVRDLPPSAVRRGDVLNPSSLLGACEGIDVVVSAVGASLKLGLAPRSGGFDKVDYQGNLNLLREAERSGVHHFVYVSVFHTPDIQDLAYIRAHRDFEDALRQSALTRLILRPTGYFDAFAVFMRIARLGTAPLIGTGQARTNPIHERDLAVACADAVYRQGEIIEIGGPEVWSRRALFELAFEAAGKPPKFSRVPDVLLHFNQRCIAPFDPRLADLVAFFQAASHTDLVAPPAGTHRIGDYFKALMHAGRVYAQ